ncbi:MAG: hypothetical protein CMJ58_14850 [Planctomycetaceae bacterium]|nr:hypothetical protein [Planctomycetaceae bacterium]
MTRYLLALGAALLALGPQGVLCAGQFNNVVSLGDSLFDDNLGNRSPVAAAHVAHQMGVPWTNYAVSGATSDALLRQGQHAAAAANFGAGDLALLWIGGNDFFYQASLPITLGFGYERTLDDAAGNVETILSTLRGAGMEVVMFNLPDMSRVPFVDLAATNFLGQRQRWLNEYAALSVDWADTLDALGAEYGAPVVDVYGMFAERVADPDAFSIMGHQVNLGPNFGGQFDIFKDPIHPSAYIQGLVANEAIEVINATFNTPGATPVEQLSQDKLAQLIGLLPSDFDADGRVTLGDLLTWEVNFGASGIDFEFGIDLHPLGDANGDGWIGGGDFLIWQRQANGGTGATPVPEPTTLGLLVAGAIATAATATSRGRRARRA